MLLSDGPLQRGYAAVALVKKARTSVAFLFIVSIMVNIGMWFERFVIIVVSLHRAFLPSGWGMFYPTIVDVGVLVGSFGLVLHLLPAVYPVLPDDRHVGDQGRGRTWRAQDGPEQR